MLRANFLTELTRTTTIILEVALLMLLFELVQFDTDVLVTNEYTLNAEFEFAKQACATVTD